MTTHNPAEAIATRTPAEAIARSLVAQQLPTLEVAMMGGAYHRVALRAAAEACGPIWARDYGSEVAQAALAILAEVSAAAIVTDKYRAAWMAAAPLGAIPDVALHPLVEIRPRSSVKAGMRILHGLRRFWAVVPRAQ